MTQSRRLSALAAVAVAVLAVGCSSSSNSSSSSSSSSGGGGGITVPSSGSGAKVNVTVSDTKGTDGPETLVPDSASAKAGDVTFTVKNTGTIEHEVVVLKTDTPFDQLTVGESEPDKVDEASSVGEVEVKAGETQSFTVTGLEPGKYVLVCNIAKHYALGMRAAFTVS